VFIWSADVSSSSQTWTPKLLHKFNDVVWHLSWSVTGNILAVSGGDNKVLRHSLPSLLMMHVFGEMLQYVVNFVYTKRCT